MVFQMYGVGVVFLGVAVVAALCGFGVVSDAAPLVARMCAVFFLLAAVAAFGWAWMNRPRAGAGLAPPRPPGARPPTAGDDIRRRDPEWEVQ